MKGAKEFIAKLINQGNESSTKFNSQEIANTLNALSKWDMLNNKKWNNGNFKDFIIRLVDQGNSIPKEQFNSQAIANTFDALYKFNVLNNNEWNDDKSKKLKSLIVSLAEKGKEISTQFNSQEVANTFNAFSKLDILDDQKWKSENTLRLLIVKLVDRDKVYENYSLKDISKTYNALHSWDVLGSNKWNDNEKGKFKTLITKLESQISAIAKEKNLVEHDIDIRFASQIIKDLPKLKLRNLITTNDKLLIPLMQCLSAGICKSEDRKLDEHWTKGNIISGLESFVEVVKDKLDLKGKFDQDFIKMLSKLSAVELDSEHNNKISEVISKLINLGAIENIDDVERARNKLSQKAQQFESQSSETPGGEPRSRLSKLTASKQQLKRSQGSH